MTLTRGSGGKSVMDRPVLAIVLMASVQRLFSCLTRAKRTESSNLYSSS